MQELTSKEYFFDQLLTEAGIKERPNLRILEVGCGTSRYVPALLEKYPEITYLGIEPITASYNEAAALLGPLDRADVIHGLAYDEIRETDDSAYDLVFSFSVLEHVKQLDRFMALSAKYLKSGGLMVHRYDLGHALYPSGVKERIHVGIGNQLPAVLPETKFVRYVPEAEVVALFKKYLDTEPYKFTVHQPRSLKVFENQVKKLEIERAGEAIQAIHEWEFEYSDVLRALPTATREKLFPTVAIWGRKA